jgi:hypothetical protein
VAADLGEEDPDGELTRIVEEARQLAALAEGGEGGEGGSLRSRGDEDEDDEEGSAEQGDEEAQAEDCEKDDRGAPAGSSRDSAKRKHPEAPRG